MVSPQEPPTSSPLLSKDSTQPRMISTTQQLDSARVTQPARKSVSSLLSSRLLIVLQIMIERTLISLLHSGNLLSHSIGSPTSGMPSTSVFTSSEDLRTTGHSADGDQVMMFQSSSCTLTFHRTSFATLLRLSSTLRLDTLSQLFACSGPISSFARPETCPSPSRV